MKSKGPLTLVGLARSLLIAPNSLSFSLTLPCPSRTPTLKETLHRLLQSYDVDYLKSTPVVKADLFGRP